MTDLRELRWGVPARSHRATYVFDATKRLMRNIPIIADLFAGVGGLSLGAARAGFKVACAVELDEQAFQAHESNFPGTTHLARDISMLDGRKLLEEIGVRMGELSGIVGGPPCQGFSSIGLRTAADPRNNLFGDFFRIVSETRPAFFLAENVPGVLVERNAKILSAALAKVPKSYVQLDPFIVKASDYGAPTTRTRVFFYGYDPDRVEVLTREDFEADDPEDIRVREALAHLPSMRSTWQSEEQSWRSVGELDDSEFADRVTDRVPFGVGNKEALDRLKSKGEVSGFLGTRHTQDTIDRFDILGPGKSDPISKCRRLDPDGYCPTLRAGTGPERGSYQAIRPVHHSSPRVICPREGARLQGFPDWFQFHPTKWHAFRQIGNSVSPIVAEALLKTIRQSIQ
jgi:DNA (cytosine-5)-methyltransferase 1